jgi:8-oxo-dGTP pyrophosphatase MutT (NUDIX family)
VTASEPRAGSRCAPRRVGARGPFRQQVPEPERRVRLVRPTLEIPSYEVLVERLEARLAPLPAGPARGASVLVACVRRVEGPTLLMTRRATSLRHHPGELSFPGGKVEQGESALEAALREAEEEVGLDPAAVRPLGLLGATTVRRLSRTLVAVAAAIDAPVPLRPNPSEVEAIVEVPLALFATDALATELWYDQGGGWGLLTFVAVGEDLLWGASARLALELVSLAVDQPRRST